jgi:hypothetical protein
MKSLLAEIEDWDSVFLSEPSQPEPQLALDHLKRQIAAQSEIALLLVKACGLEVPTCSSTT